MKRIVRRRMAVVTCVALVLSGLLAGGQLASADTAAPPAVIATIANDATSQNLPAPFGAGATDSSVYVTNATSYGSPADIVSVIDPTTNTVKTTITVGDNPRDVLVAGSAVYISNSGSHSISVIDPATNTVVDTIDTGSGTAPYGMAISGSTLYATDSVGNAVLVIDLTTKTVTATIPVGTNPRAVVVVGSSLYVSNFSSNTVSVVDPAAQKITATIDTNPGPRGMVIVGSTVYVASQYKYSVQAIDTATNTVTATISVGGQPITGTLLGTDLYVANAMGNSVSVIDTTTNTVTATVDVGMLPYGVAAWKSRVYVTNNGGGSIGDSNSGSSVSVIGHPSVTPAAQTINGELGKSLNSQPLTASDFAGPATFSLISGQTLPPGLSLDPKTGVISGIPTLVVGQKTYTINASDGTSTLPSTVDLAVAVAFSDVPGTAMFHDEIMWLANNNIATGWLQPDGSRVYQPLASIHRDAMAAYLYRLAGSPAFTPPVFSPFSDVAPSDAYYKEICWMWWNGIASGYPDFSFRPTDPVNRDAMAAFLYRYAGSPSYTPPTTSPFADVHPTDAYYKEMTWLATQKISTGWADGTYQPLTPVARDAMAAFLNRLYTNVTNPAA